MLPYVGGIKGIKTGAISSWTPSEGIGYFAANKVSAAISNILLFWGKDYRRQTVDRGDWWTWVKHNIPMSVQSVIEALDRDGLTGLYMDVPWATLGGGITRRPLTLNDIAMREYGEVFHLLGTVTAEQIRNGVIDRRAEVRRLLKLEQDDTDKKREEEKKAEKDLRDIELDMKRQEAEERIRERERRKREKDPILPKNRNDNDSILPTPTKSSWVPRVPIQFP
tara:strand:- start:42 stop:710 length:669 start_codon:yes stop_codon:yes gene_type:complete